LIFVKNKQLRLHREVKVILGFKSVSRGVCEFAKGENKKPPETFE